MNEHGTHNPPSEDEMQWSWGQVSVSKSDPHRVRVFACEDWGGAPESFTLDEAKELISDVNTAIAWIESRSSNER